MRQIILFALIFTLLIASCRRNVKSLKDVDSKSLMTDSFVLEGIGNYEQALFNITQLRNGDYIGVDRFAGLIRFNSRGKLLLTRPLPFQDSCLRSISIPDDSTIQLSGDGQIVYISDTSLKTFKRYYLPHNLPFCASDYALSGADCQPIRNDTLYAFISTPTPWEERRYELSKIPMQIKFKLVLDDTATLLSRHIERPAYLSESRSIAPLITLKGDSILYVMPNRDSILVYDLKTKISHTIPLNNPDFVKPEIYSNPSHKGGDNYAYIDKYLIKNYMVYGFFYLPQTKHYVLEYETPVVAAAIKDRLPTALDKPHKLLVLDEQLRPLSTVLLPKGFYGNVAFTNNAGLVFPVYNPQLLGDSGKIKCYVYKL